jgi:hypothetical protein
MRRSGVAACHDGTMADERRPSPPARGPRNRPNGGRTPNAPLTGPLVVDAATNDALRLFNARLSAQAENEKAERRVQKAAKAKDDAAGRVRNLENDTKATAEQRAEAAAAYRAAVEAWERARNGEPDPVTPRGSTAAGESTDDAVTDDAVTDDAVTDDAPTGESTDDAVTDDQPADAVTDDQPADATTTEDAPEA